jgi:hypothetical protein
MAHTRCGKVLHRKWVLQDGPVECNDCIPTLAGMLKRLAGLPKEIRMAGKRLGVARA